MAQPLINGQEYEWAIVTCNAGGVKLNAVTAISYDDPMDMENNKGMGQHPVSRSYGSYSPTGSITIMMSDLVRLEEGAPNGKLQKIREFDINVAFKPGQGKIQRHKIKACRFMNNGRDMSQGNKTFETQINLIVGEIDFQA